MGGRDLRHHRAVAERVLKAEIAAALGVARCVTAAWAARELESASFRLTEDTCRRLDKASFDPRMLGDRLQYLDNRMPSDVLVCCFPACGHDAHQFAPFLRTTRHRGAASSRTARTTTG